MRNSYLCLVSICLLVLICGCGKPVHRFLPIGESGGAFALDTKTGQRCLIIPKGMVSGGNNSESGPYCYDLYKDE